MSEFYVLNADHSIVVTDSVEEWGRFFRQTELRRVAKTERDGIEVSTVFLGIDHQFGDGPPLLFETMIFGGAHGGDTWRYSTWKEAKKGHKKACLVAFGGEAWWKRSQR